MMTKTQNNNEGITPPTAGEVAELVAAVQAAYSAYGWVEEKQFIRLFDEVARLASVIEEGCDCSVDGPMDWQAEIARLRPPAPVPVTEGMPRPEDCDTGGRCWWVYPPDFMELRSHATEESAFVAGATHWLPAHALPTPITPPEAEPPESKGSESPLLEFGPNEMPLG